MISFKVIEIMDFDTIRVSPAYILERKGSRFQKKSDLLKLRGMPKTDSVNVEIIKNRLNTLLINQEIDLRAEQIIQSSANEDNILVGGDVYLSDTNILYYFPDYKKNRKFECAD
jgi:hypothetical protein